MYFVGQPSIPTLYPQSTEAFENDPFYIICGSRAHPAPQLRIRLGGVQKAISPAVGGKYTATCMYCDVLASAIPL